MTMHKNLFKKFVLMAIFAGALALPNTAKAEENTNFGNAEAELTMPFTLDLFQTAYEADENKDDLSNNLTTTSSDKMDSYSKGGLSLAVTEETANKGDRKVVKMEFSYSPVENVKVKTRNGGLMLYKRVDFEPSRTSTVVTEQAGPPPQ